MGLAIGIVLLLAAALLITAGFFLARVSMTGKRQTLEEARSWQETHYDFSWYDALENDTDPVVLPEQACVVSEILEAIYTSAKTGKPVFFD